MMNCTVVNTFLCADKHGRKLNQTNYRTDFIHVNLFLYELCNWIYFAFIKPRRRKYVIECPILIYNNVSHLMCVVYLVVKNCNIKAINVSTDKNEM
jgi:hypothetical protein